MRKKWVFFGIAAVLTAIVFIANACEGTGNETVPPVFYTVTFKSNGGSSVASQTVAAGGKVVAPFVTKTGHTLEGWYAAENYSGSAWNFASDVVTADITLYAKWTQILAGTFTVTFNSKGGSAVTAQTVANGGTANKPTGVTRTGYALEGWYAAENYSGSAWNFASDIVTADITLYAKWTQLGPFTVTFNSNGGSAVTAQTVAHGGKAAAPTGVTKAGYILEGWYGESTLSYKWNFTTNTVTADITLYAKWTPIFTVTFNSNGGPAVPAQSVPDGGRVNEPTGVTRTGYTLEGWYKEPAFINKWNFYSSAITANTTLYAKWTQTLLRGLWTNGAITSSNGEQWFRFKATDTTQYIHVIPGTLNNLNIQVYNSSNAAVGAPVNFNGGAAYTSRTVTEEQTYYIRVWPNSSGNSGAYQIAFTEFSTPPSNPVTLTSNVWENVVGTNEGEQWFKFTATADTQFFHITFGKQVSELIIRVYDRLNVMVDSVTMSGVMWDYESMPVTRGAVYYIQVLRAHLNYTYQIAFNESNSRPAPVAMPVNVTALTSGVWTSDLFGKQWFSFTATADTQYIHAANIAFLRELYVQLYNASDGTAVGNMERLVINNDYAKFSRAVTNGQLYYIQAWTDSFPTASTYHYKIAFNTSSTHP
jgi:uncharacterized repeat protein (TIGR02543 family)